MANYRYTARDMQGKMVTGVTDASSETMVASILRDQGLIPTLISLGSTTSQRNGHKGKTGQVRLDDLVVFSRQFATMIRAGLPLIEVLNILGEQCERDSLKQVVKQIEKDVGGGSSLTEALQKHPTVFSSFYISMVRAGEAGGMLETILDQVAGYMEKVVSMQRKIKSAVMYPAVVALVAIGITIFLLAFVVPVFKQIFDSLQGTLPMTTRIVMFLSDTIRERFVLSAVIVVLALFLFFRWKATSAGRAMVDRIKLRIPVFGDLLLKVSIARFTRTLGTLIRSGVNILPALEIVASTSGNTVIEKALLNTRTAIQEGETIAEPLIESGVFPPMVTRMIDVGERTGGLESMLNKIAEFYEDEVDAKVAGLTSLIEPILMVFLGVMVGFIVIAMFMPLFTMIRYIK